MPLPDTTAMNPQIQYALEHWRRIAPGEGLLPGRQHFDPVDVPSLLPNLWMLDVQREPLRLRCRLLGTHVQQAGARAKVGYWLDETYDPDTLKAVIEFTTPVIERGEPAWRKGTPLLPHLRQLQSLEVIALPMASNGHDVDLILNVTVFSWEPGWKPRVLGGS